MLRSQNCLQQFDVFSVLPSFDAERRYRMLLESKQGPYRCDSDRNMKELCIDRICLNLGIFWAVFSWCKKVRVMVLLQRSLDSKPRE